MNERVNPDIEFLTWLMGEGYLEPKPIGNGRWAAARQMMFTAAVMTGRMRDYTSVEDRWCYMDMAKALKALAEWDGSGEPKGWHRHPMSGRRVSETGEEYIAP